MPQNPSDGAGIAPVVLSERSTEDKIRYASEKLTEIHDKLIDTAGRDHRATLLALAMHLDRVADEVAKQEEECHALRSASTNALYVAEVIEANGVKWAADSVRRAVNGGMA